MKIWLSIPIVMLTFLGCTWWGETREKTLTARRVTEENVFSYGSVFVQINPDLEYVDISGDIKIEIMGKVSTPTKRRMLAPAKTARPTKGLRRNGGSLAIGFMENLALERVRLCGRTTGVALRLQLASG